MEDTLKQINSLIEANQKDENRTPHLDMALGGLTTARDQVGAHVAALKRIAAAKAAEVKPQAPAAKA